MIGDDWGQPYDKMPLRWWIEDIAKAICMAATVAVFVAIVAGMAHYG